jgi:adenylate cyclase
LQRCLSQEMAPFRRLEVMLTVLTLAALLISALIAAWLARGISRPVQDLSDGAGRVGAGVYDKPVPVRSRDELGQLAASFNTMTQGLVERDKVRDLLGRNVSREVASELLRRPAALGGEEREATVLFTDIRGFTALSETAQPSALLGVLNSYFTELSRVIENHGGVVDKYIGDAVMAVFGAPVADPDHALHAAECARAIGRVMRTYNEDRTQNNLPRLDTGVGVATGTVVAGLMGSASRHNYTVIGDTVNLAARLQDETKRFGVSPVIAASTVQACGRPDWFSPLGEVIVRGKKEAVSVFTLHEENVVF